MKFNCLKFVYINYVNYVVKLMYKFVCLFMVILLFMIGNYFNENNDNFILLSEVK